MKFAAGEFERFGDDQDLLDAWETLQRLTDRWVDAPGSCARSRWADRAEHANHGAFDTLREMTAQSVIFEEGHYMLDSFVVTMSLHYDNHENCSFVSFGVRRLADWL